MKPTNKQIDAFFQGMEYAARIAASGEDFQAALNIRKQAIHMTRKTNHGQKNKSKINSDRKISVQKICKEALHIFGKISSMVSRTSSKCSLQQCKELLRKV